MSKSLNNYIGITEHPNDIYGKIMSIPDHLIELYMKCLTDIEETIIQELKNGLDSNNINPMDYKKLLAYQIVLQFYTKKDADLSEKNFKESVQEKKVKFEKINFEINKLNPNDKLSKMLFSKNLVASTSEFKRLLKQNGVKLNGEILSEDVSISKIKDGYEISLGKRTNIEINF